MAPRIHTKKQTISTSHHPHHSLCSSPSPHTIDIERVEPVTDPKLLVSASDVSPLHTTHHTFTSLPDELLLLILRFIPPHDRSEVGTVSKKMYRISSDVDLWTCLPLSPLRDIIDDERLLGLTRSRMVYSRRGSSESNPKPKPKLEVELEGTRNKKESGGGRYSPVRVLDLEGCSNVTDVGVGNVLEKCGLGIRVLNLNGCSKLTDVTGRNIGEWCRNIQEVSLSRCDVSDETLMMVSRCKQLRRLDISGCDRVTDEGVLEVLRRCRGLETLVLHLCTELSDAVVDEIRHNATHLVHVDLSFCINITTAPIRSLVYSLEESVERCLEARKRRRYAERYPGFFSGHQGHESPVDDDDDDRVKLRTLCITGCPLISDPWDHHLEMALKEYHRVYDVL